MKSLTLICLFLLSGIPLMAQDDFVRKMNDIKMSDDYYTAHSRDETEEKAYMVCISNILNQVRQNHQGSYDETFIMQHSERMTKKREQGEPFRVFVYLKKSSLTQKTNRSTAIVFKKDIQTEKESQKPDPVPISEPAPQPKYEPAPQPIYEPAHDNSMISKLVTDIMSRNGIGNAYRSFESKKSVGTVSDYGALKNVEDLNSIYIVIYDKGGQTPRAILSPLEGGMRKNLITNTPDSYSNYHGVEAFWFSVK